MADTYALESLIKTFANQENCITGICDTAPLPLNPTHFTPFVTRNQTKRTNPTANLPGAKTIIVIGVESKIKDFPPAPEDAGILSVLGIANDYHITVKALLKKLANELQSHTNFMYKILVDSPTLDERALAVRAGLGYIGRNGLVISPEYGSRFNIGVLLTDLPLPATSYQPRHCEEQSDEAIQQNRQPSDNRGLLHYTHYNKASTCPPKCNLCITACPTNALSNSAPPDATRCISYLTQKENLTPEEATLIGRHLYGCDICQNVCPQNQPTPVAWANPEDWLTMSDEGFTKTYGHTAMLWRGAKLLKRNAKHVKCNLQSKPFTQ